jgi:hypothetical protein
MEDTTGGEVDMLCLAEIFQYSDGKADETPEGRR